MKYDEQEAGADEEAEITIETRREELAFKVGTQRGFAVELPGKPICRHLCSWQDCPALQECTLLNADQ